MKKKKKKKLKKGSAANPINANYHFAKNVKAPKLKTTAGY